MSTKACGLWMMNTVVFCGLAVAKQGVQQSGGGSEADKDLPNSTAFLMSFGFREMVATNYYGSQGGGNQIRFEPAIPFRSWGTTNIMQISVPIKTGGVQGNRPGDVTVFNVIPFPAKGARFAIGPVVNFATKPATKTDNFQADATEPRSPVSATPGQSQAGQASQRSLEEIAKELENPMSTTWSLVFQDNLNLLQGDAVEGTQVGDTFLFQPALPIPMGRRAVLIARPVFPIVSLPELDAASPGGVKGRQTGFGDMQVLALLGTTTPKGLVYAAGVTSIFPTASNENLGGGKYQAGPSVALGKVGAKLVYGISAQHWWSFAGDDARRDVSQTNIGYFLSKTLPKAWSVGTSPTISINWNGADRNRLTFPVGLGPSKMVRIGSTPVRLRFEVQYSVVRPESYGTRWNFRFQAVPVIKSPFAR